MSASSRSEKIKIENISNKAMASNKTEEEMVTEVKPEGNSVEYLKKELQAKLQKSLAKGDTW